MESSTATSFNLSSGDTPTLYAFSASGTSGCSGTPITCSPLWTASLGASNSPDYYLTVGGGVVYVDGGAGLEAFDATGQKNCSGTPIVCQPLWQASVIAGEVPTLSYGYVYASSSGGLDAFDANGTTNCSGSPTVCTPVWTSSVGQGPVAISGGMAYVSHGSEIAALDATGNTNCSGTPKVCTPLWNYAPTFPAGNGSDTLPVVFNNTLYTEGWTALSRTSFEGALEAFDATGVNGCSGPAVPCGAQPSEVRSIHRP